MVHPSKSEGLPRVVMESFSCGVPVIGLKAAMPGAFEHGVHGLLVEEHELLDATRDLLNDNERLVRMGRNAREYAREKCSMEVASAAIKGMYQVVLRDGTPSKRSWYQMGMIRFINLVMDTREILTSVIKKV